ncbi:MAG: tyrosine-type recombinase/integrase [Acidobacteria bacterium]|nr:tyrosine-type recombinase/integrase [Acidobacteriota bacterium]
MPCAARERVGFRFRFHDLRHTYATSLITAGAPPQLVAAAMGSTDRRR